MGTNEVERRRIEEVLARRFASAGGTPAEWLSEKDSILAQHRRDQVLSQPIPDVDPAPRDLARGITADDEAAAILARSRRL